MPGPRPSGSPFTRKRAALAALVRHGTADQVAAARADLAAAEPDYRADRLAEYIRRVADQVPPLNAEQRERVARVLCGPAELRAPVA